MSKSSNLAAIGVFVVIGTLLTLGGIAALTSGILFSPKLHVVTFFNESVAGLNVGAPTKFQGVIIGKVTKISFWQQEVDSTQSYIRVEAEIDVTLAVSLGAKGGFDHESQMAKSIHEGMRANLATESMVTGIRYIEINFDRTAPEPVFLNTIDGFIEVPSTPSALAGLTESVSEIVARVGAIDLPALTGDLRELLEIAKSRAEDLDIQGITDQMMRTMKAAENMMANQEIDNSLKSLEETLAALRDLATTLNNESKPMMANLDSAAVALNATLQSTRDLLENTESLMAPEGSFRYETETAMREMGEMARALRLLADELERNPGSLIRGKAEN